MGCSLRRVACIGMATLDTILYKETLSTEQEAVNVLDRHYATVGGKGLITAMALQYCSVEPILVSMVGRESKIRQACVGRIPTAALIPILIRDHRTWIIVDRRQAPVTYVGLGEFRQEALDSYTSSVIAAVDVSDMVYLSTENRWLIGTVLAHLEYNRLPLITNLCLPLLQTLGKRQVIQDLVTRSRVLLMNQIESRYALKMLGTSSGRSVRSPTLCEIVITQGDGGGRFSQYPFGSWSSYEAIRPSAVRCAVGAGDTFNGAYVARRFGSDYGMEESCLAAAELAALKVAQEGTSLAW